MSVLRVHSDFAPEYHRARCGGERERVDFRPSYPLAHARRHKSPPEYARSRGLSGFFILAASQAFYAQGMPTPRKLAFLLIPFALTAATGCVVEKTFSATGSLLKTTITTTGKVAGESMKAAGSLATAGVKTAGDVIRPSAVKVVEEGGRTARRMPWKEGMTLYAASKRAELDAGVRALEVLRGSQVIRREVSELQQEGRDVALQRGDVIKLIK